VPTVIENPILNSPFDEPARHFKFDDNGITDEIADGRRESGYFLPIASPRKKGGQLKFETEWTQDRFQSSPRINRIRDRDTNYDGESFFVRHAYFTGADEPYDKLKRALRADIDEAAWSTLYRTESRAFAPPDTGKIAVKVINHYGDEVLKVFEV
jgi:hypothetical protein